MIKKSKQTDVGVQTEDGKQGLEQFQQTITCARGGGLEPVSNTFGK